MRALTDRQTADSIEARARAAKDHAFRSRMIAAASLWLVLFVSPQYGAFGQTPSAAPPAPRRHSPASAANTTPAALDEMASQADAARTSGDTKTAIRLYEQVLRARPAWPEGWWYLGTMLYDSDQFSKALPAFSRLTKLEPKMGSAWAFLGLCEFELRDYKSSLPHLRRAREIGIDDAGTARVSDYHLALLLNLDGRFEDAASVLIAQFGQERLTPQVATAMGLSLLRMPILPAALDVSNKELVFTAGQALSQMAHQRYPEALDILQSLLKEHPDTSYLRYSSAIDLMLLSRPDDAIEQLRAELKVTPGSVATYLLLAKIQLKRDKTDEALVAAQQAAALQPKNPYAHQALAECYARSGRLLDAQREAALAESFGLPPRGATSASVPLAQGQSRPEPSSAGETGAATDPGAKLAELQNQAQAALQAGKVEEAVRAYREGLDLRPDWSEGILDLASLYYNTQRYNDALPLARRLVKLKPNTGTAWGMLGLCEFGAENFDDALVHLRRGRDLGFPTGGAEVAEANYHIGILLNWRGEFDPAHALLLQETKAEYRADDAKFALGINLLRLRLLPSQVKDSDRKMVQVAAGIAMDLSASNYPAASAKFDELLRSYPDRTYIHDAYAWALMSISRYDAAVEQFRLEIGKSPQATEAYLGLATAAIKTHDYREARAAARKAVELAPDSAMAHAQYGRALVELSELNTGIAELETAVRLAVHIPELHYSLSRAYAKANRPKDAERERQIFLRLNKQASQQ
jgi:tetratricopeptide (TPR) repeat protein